MQVKNALHSHELIKLCTDLVGKQYHTSLVLKRIILKTALSKPCGLRCLLISQVILSAFCIHFEGRFENI